MIVSVTLVHCRETRFKLILYGEQISEFVDNLRQKYENKKDTKF